MDTEIPRAVDTRNDGVDGVLEPLRDPVHGECNEDDQSDDFAFAAAASIRTAVGVVRRRVPFHINSNHCDGKPGTKSRGEDATNKADEVDVAVLLADVDARLEHQRRKGNSRDPGVKGKGHEGTKDKEHDSGGIILLVEIEYGGANSEDDVEDTGYPDERLRKHAR